MKKRKKFLSALTFVFILICHNRAAAQNISPSDFFRESHQADQFIGEKHLESAKQILLRLVATHRGRAHEYSQLAFCYLQMLPGVEDFRAAEICAHKAISLDPESGEAYGDLAAATMGRDDYKGAIIAATKALDCKKPDDSAAYLRARAFSALHKYNEALRDFERHDRYISKYDKSQISVTAQGEILEKMGKMDDAIKKYKQDAPYRPEQSIKNAVRCLESQKKYPEAIAAVSDLIKRNNDDSDAFNLRANIKAHAKDWKGAVTDYSHAISLSPTSSYYKSRAQAYEALGQKDLAKKDLVSAEKPLY